MTEAIVTVVNPQQASLAESFLRYIPFFHLYQKVHQQLPDL